MMDIKIKFSEYKGHKYFQFEKSLNFQIINIKFDQNHFPCKIEMP